MIQDADGNEITRTVIQTREVIEKGSWDDLFALEGGGNVHMKLQFFLSEEEHNRIRRIRESVVKKKHDTTTLRATTIGLPLKVERDILVRPPQNKDGTVEYAAILYQPSEPQTYIAKKEETTLNQQETSPIDTDRNTLETSLLAVSESSGTQGNTGNYTRNVDVAYLSQPSDSQTYIAKKEETVFNQQENSPNDTDKSTLETSVLAVSKSSGTKRHLENEKRNNDVAQPSSDPQTYIAKKEKVFFHQQKTSSNDTDKSTIETSALAVSKSSGTERNIENTTRLPFSSLTSLSKSRSEGTLISIGKREFEKTPSNVRKMISAFESSQPLLHVKHQLPSAKPTSKLQQQTFAVDGVKRPSPEAESSSMESDTGRIEPKVSESLPEVKKNQVEVTAVSGSMYEEEQLVLMDNQKEGEDALDNTTSEHDNAIEASTIEASGSFVGSWIFPDYNRHLCITTASKKFKSMTRECWMQEKTMKRKVGNSIEKKKNEKIPRSSDAEGRERLVSQVKRVAIMVGFGALVFLTRERNS